MLGADCWIKSMIRVPEVRPKLTWCQNYYELLWFNTLNFKPRPWSRWLTMINIRLTIVFRQTKCFSSTLYLCCDVGHKVCSWCLTFFNSTQGKSKRLHVFVVFVFCTILIQHRTAVYQVDTVYTLQVVQWQLPQHTFKPCVIADWALKNQFLPV